MAEQLKDQFGPEKVRLISEMISNVYTGFPADAFEDYALDGFESLELTERGRKIMYAMRRFLPDDYSEAVGILIRSLGPKLADVKSFGMDSFIYMPHVYFVAEYGLQHFEESMLAQYELTQRFTAEFSIRRFLEEFPDQTLRQLKEWTADESEHVRRLVSEGARPRLPWAPRLKRFQKDPGPVVELLELLKDDPELYVRRSVANNLNDIGKDNPDILYSVTRRWMKDATPEMEWLVRHALRSVVKKGEPEAFAILGFDAVPDVEINKVSIFPSRPKIGERLELSFRIVNPNPTVQKFLVDLRVHYVKANGKTSPKVFKLKAVELESKQEAVLGKKIHLRQMTTRKHYPGLHRLEILLNGTPRDIGSFMLEH